MTSLLLFIAPRPALRRRVIAALARHPDLFDRLLELNDGRASLRDLGAGGVARPVGGMLSPPDRTVAS